MANNIPANRMYDRKNYTMIGLAPLPRQIHSLKVVPELGYFCATCGSHCIETEIGVVKGCEHHVPDLVSEPQLVFAKRLLDAMRKQIVRKQLTYTHAISRSAKQIEHKIFLFYQRPLDYDTLAMALTLVLARSEWDTFAMSQRLPLSCQFEREIQREEADAHAHAG